MLRRDRWFLGDVREVIRFGLEGSGMKPKDAARLVETYVDQQPTDEHGAHCQSRSSVRPSTSRRSINDTGKAAGGGTA